MKKKLAALTEKPWFFAFALLVLNTLLVLPLTAFQSGALRWTPWPETYEGLFRFMRFYLMREQQDVFRLSVEFWLMLTLLFMSAGTTRETLVRRLCSLGFHLLLLYKVYEAINLLLFGKQPNFYDDSGLIVGAFNLVLDIRTVIWPLAFLGAILALAIFRYLNVLCFKSIVARFRENRGASIKLILAMGWVFIIACTTWYNGKELLDKIAVNWISPRVFFNARDSVNRYRHMRAVKTGPPAKYYDFQQTVLRNPPPIYFFMLESYGRFITEDPSVRDDYFARMRDHERVLNRRGLRAVTNFSSAPIRGGRSWLSISSVFSGIRIDNQTVYNEFARKRKRLTHLSKFLRRRGYTTAGLQPSNRPRPGVPQEDYYEFTQPIFYNQLNYRGRPYGWGIIPDQYSLFYSHDRYLHAAKKPLFLFFMTVTSHAPWRLENLPPYAKDYRDLNRPPPPAPPRKEGLVRGLLRAMRGHYRSAREDMNAKRCALFVMHDMRVLMDYIAQKVPRNALVIILGDHQPAFWTGVPPGDETPLHVISGDSKLLSLFREFGFTRGLPPRKDALAPGSVRLRHEGLYSLLVHALARRYGKPGTTPPVYRPRGLPLSVLRD